jgi:hypothetical protein
MLSVEIHMLHILYSIAIRRRLSLPTIWRSNTLVTMKTACESLKFPTLRDHHVCMASKCVFPEGLKCLALVVSAYSIFGWTLRLAYPPRLRCLKTRMISEFRPVIEATLRV